MIDGCVTGVFREYFGVTKRNALDDMLRGGV